MDQFRSLLGDLVPTNIMETTNMEYNISDHEEKRSISLFYTLLEWPGKGFMEAQYTKL